MRARRCAGPRTSRADEAARTGGAPPRARARRAPATPTARSSRRGATTTPRSGTPASAAIRVAISRSDTAGAVGTCQARPHARSSPASVTRVRATSRDEGERVRHVEVARQHERAAPGQEPGREVPAEVAGGHRPGTVEVRGPGLGDPGATAPLSGEHVGPHAVAHAALGTGGGERGVLGHRRRRRARSRRGCPS